MIINAEHLGGFSKEDTTGDVATYHPILWKYMIDTYNIKSLLDIGCGMGISTKFFHDNGCSVQAIEGHPFCIENSKMKDYILHHDYSHGESNLIGTYDLCWSCEFVEHVEEKYSENFIKNFAQAKIVMITHATPGQGGWHHVNCQPASYWIEKLAKHGLIYDEKMTEETRKIAESDWKLYSPGYKSHYVDKGLVFKNKNYD
jgi:cyclopropane fatty-acyl-phospholipid synthase-like methyltransferase